MQLSLLIDDRRQRLLALHRALRSHFGHPGPWRHLDPVSQLVLGMVGGRTHEAVSRRAFEVLFTCFRSWERVRDAAEIDVYRAVHRVTYAERKARRLQAALRQVTHERGRLTLDFLAALSVPQALSWLERLPGVGRKTSAVTLNFSTLRMPALVIDTHHLRVLRRLRLIGRRATTVDAYDHVMSHLPSDWEAADYDDHHQLMKQAGQSFCRHAEPNCAACPLRRLCPSAAHVGRV